jgi:hypothetical protein
MGRPPKPGGSVIEPRRYTDVPKKFGQTSSRLTKGRIDSAQQGAAELQHALVNRIREHLLDSGMDLRAYCAATELPSGLSYERLYRISTGAGMMGLTDLMFWAARVPGFADIARRTMEAMVVEVEPDAGADAQPTV